MTEVAAEECLALSRRAVFETYRARETALGNLPIARALPVRGRRLIGAWCFLDRYGPISFTDDKPMDVAPHPHIGLQTVSWLVAGEVVHHDSLGLEGVVRPGGVNVMTAGRGIAHAEETPVRNEGRLHGVQLWIALPEEHRNTDPAFDPIPRVPSVELPGGVVQIFVGELEGERSPAPLFSDLVGMDAAVHPGERLIVPASASSEYGVMLLGGEAEFDGTPLDGNAIHYLGCGRTEIPFRSAAGARLLLLGGVPLGEPVLMWWNFVARTREEIAAARAAWERGELGEVRAYEGPRLEAPPLERIAPPNPAS
ncbi:MAG: pirin family protein [Thermoanaerobaculia bacterium]